MDKESNQRGIAGPPVAAASACHFCNPRNRLPLPIRRRDLTWAGMLAGCWQANTSKRPAAGCICLFGVANRLLEKRAASA